MVKEKAIIIEDNSIRFTKETMNEKSMPYFSLRFKSVSVNALGIIEHCVIVHRWVAPKIIHQHNSEHFRKDFMQIYSIICSNYSLVIKMMACSLKCVGFNTQSDQLKDLKIGTR